jgi:Gnt-I system high-affinity gluconate transporter
LTLLILILAIGLQIFLTTKKVSPFLSLLIVAILTGFALGMDGKTLLATIEQGVGKTVASLALILCLGAILGKILEISGAAEQIASTLIRGFGQKNIQWAVLLTGFLIGIPLYYNAGFVILVPLIFSIAKRTGLPLLYIAIPMAASLSTTHCFLPPHPSPVFLVKSFKADMGLTLVYGFIIAIPVVIIAGIGLGRFLKSIHIDTGKLFSNEPDIPGKQLPNAAISFFIALLPVLLITLAVLAQNFLADGTIEQNILLFIGDSTIALLIAVLAAIAYFSAQRGHSIGDTMKWLNDGISGIAVILLIITAGGVFKEVLTASGTGKEIASLSKQWNMHPLVFAWTITALLRVSIGSATVAGTMAAAVVLELADSPSVSPELLVLAVGTGSVFGSHVNDTGFWMFKEFFKLSLKQTFLSWTVMETLISILGLIGVLLLNMFI